MSSDQEKHSENVSDTIFQLIDLHACSRGTVLHFHSGVFLHFQDGDLYFALFGWYFWHCKLLFCELLQDLLLCSFSFLGEEL